MDGKDFDFTSEFFKEVLDHLHTNIYITELESDRIVYMNETMKETFHLEHPENYTCWKVLQTNMTGRCGFCKKKELQEGKPVCIWNEHNPVTDRIYQNYDSLFFWGEKAYHIQNSADVTEYKQLIEAARIDDLTGLLNRRGGKEKLSLILEQAKLEQMTLTLMLYDVNELKLVNDRYGHSEGDNLLRYITEVAGRRLGKRDFFFRLSGDEFVVVFYGEGLPNARLRAEKILQDLREKKIQDSLPYDMSFSYGLTEVYPGDSYSLMDIIARADEQMYIQKRDFHIKKSLKKLTGNEQTDSAGGKKFEYNKEYLFDALQESTDDYIFIGNLKTGVFQYSSSMEKEFGLPGEVVENAAAVWGKLVHPHDERGFLESNQEIADGRAESHCIEYRAKNRKGEWIWLRCRGRMIRDRKGAPSLFSGFISNLGKREQVDHVTGLSGRFSFEGDIKKYLADDLGTKQIGIMILNMDAFKNINDLYDQSFGDGILRITARRISDLLPGNARIYRLDGDEFGIIVLNGGLDDYKKIYSRIQQQFQKQQEYNGRKYYCTVSAGYASYPEDADNYLDLVRCANYSLEFSKLKGRNRITRFFPEILQKKERRLELAELLRESIERGFAGFSVRFQPQVNAGTGELFGAEALARWRCNKYGEVTPGEFIPLLEQTGMIVPFGKWIFEQASGVCKAWCEAKKDFHMSINLSYRQLQEGNLAGFVREVLEKLQLSPSNITLELTETYLMKEDIAAGKIMDELRDIGVGLAMDDFGVGYSSLFSLKNVPVDLVKIDRGFVKGITEDLFNATFIRSITELCHDVGKYVCLEGVETDEEYRAVKPVGLNLIQGYYFGKPQTRSEFEDNWITEPKDL